MPLEDAPWEIWEDPKPGEEYLISLDTSLGKEDRDPCAGLMFTMTDVPYRQVGQFYGHLSVEEQAQTCAYMAKIYNDAWHVIEDNNTGHAVIVESKHHNTRHITRTYQKPRGQGIEKRLGLTTGPRTKLQIIMAGRAAFLEGQVLLRGAELIKGLLVFRYFRAEGAITDRIISQANQPDHLQMAYSLAALVLRQRSLYIPVEPEKVRKQRWYERQIAEDEDDDESERTVDTWLETGAQEWGTWYG